MGGLTFKGYVIILISKEKRCDFIFHRILPPMESKSDDVCSDLQKVSRVLDSLIAATMSMILIQQACLQTILVAIFQSYIFFQCHVVYYS